VESGGHSQLAIMDDLTQVGWKLMDHIESLFHDLSKIAKSMEALHAKPDAKVFYDIFSGALYWTDEMPKGGDVSSECLRFVLKYRTGLIVQEPEASFELFWQEAKRRFPNWIGFSSERTAPNQQLAAYYHCERKRVENEARAES
jgi:hypothetical protein